MQGTFSLINLEVIDKNHNFWVSSTEFCVWWADFVIAWPHHARSEENIQCLQGFVHTYWSCVRGGSWKGSVDFRLANLSWMNFSETSFFINNYYCSWSPSLNYYFYMYISMNMYFENYFFKALMIVGLHLRVGKIVLRRNKFLFSYQLFWVVLLVGFWWEIPSRCIMEVVIWHGMK